MKISEHPELQKLLAEPEIAKYAKSMAEMPPGYYSNPELGHRVAGNDLEDRKAFYRLVNTLERCGEIATLNAWHNQSRLRIIEIEDGYLRDLFAEVQ